MMECLKFSHTPPNVRYLDNRESLKRGILDGAQKSSPWFTSVPSPQVATDAKNVRRELQQPATTQIRVRYARLTPSLQGCPETGHTSPQFWGDGISNVLFPLYVGEGIRYRPYAQKCVYVR